MRYLGTRKLFSMLVAGMAASLLVAMSFQAWGGTEAQIKMEQGKEAFSDRNYAEALELFQAVTAEEPNNGEAYHYAGLCLMGLNRPAEAVSMLEKAQSLLPGNLSVQEDLAWAAITAGDYEKALAAADAVLGRDQNQPRAIYYKGLALMGLKRYEEALPWFQKLASFPQYAQAGYYFSGVCLSYLGRLDDARRSFEKAAAADPNTEMGKEAKKYAETLRGAGGAAPEKKAYSGRVRLLYQYDTNILPVHSEDFLPEDVSHKEDGRMVLDLDGRYHFVNTGTTVATVRYIGYFSWHSRESEVNLMQNGGEVSGSYTFKTGSRLLKVGAAADYSASTLDNDAYSTNWSVRPEFSILWTPSLRTRLVVGYAGETFEDPGEGENNRDNTRIGVTVYQHFLFSEGRVNTWLGYRWRQVTAEGDNYNRTDNTILAGAVVLFPKDFLLTVTGRYEMRDYPDNAFDREEDLTVVNLSLQFPLTKQLSLYAGAVYMNVDANFDVLEYERWIYSGGVMTEF